MIYLKSKRLGANMSTVHKTSEARRRASKKYVDSHKEETKTRLALYYQGNKERLKARRRERYAIQKASRTGVLSSEQIGLI